MTTEDSNRPGPDFLFSLFRPSSKSGFHTRVRDNSFAWTIISKTCGCKRLLSPPFVHSGRPEGDVWVGLLYARYLAH